LSSISFCTYGTLCREAQIFHSRFSSNLQGSGPEKTLLSTRNSVFWKRWRQGYKLEELIREICLIRRNFIDTWLKAFTAADDRFDFDAQNAARRVVECFFDNVIIEATAQFVEEHQEAVGQLNAGLKPRVTANADFVQRITHILREPLGPLLLGLEVLLREEALSPRGVEMIGVLQRGVEKEAQAIEELLRSTELFEKDAAQNS